MNAIKQVKKSENIGVTFDGLVATAFPGVNPKLIKHEILPGFSSCGLVHVDGVAYDYVDHGDHVNFMRAE